MAENQGKSANATGGKEGPRERANAEANPRLQRLTRMTLLTRCAHCMRSALHVELLYCIHCHLSFCRGACHGDHVAMRWASAAAVKAHKEANDVAALAGEVGE